jgi:hypothetical protein
MNVLPADDLAWRKFRRFGTLQAAAALKRRITPELTMSRLLPHYLVFLGAHALLIAAVIALY